MMTQSSSTFKNIIIFGETGVGKSSLINMLTGTNMAKVSDSAIGCTLNFSCYTSGNYKFYDTVGLSEGSRGAMESKAALMNLFKLIKSLSEGVNLLIFVIKKDRIKLSMEQNYKLFVNAICMNKVPVLLVITNCEFENEMGKWWSLNKLHFDNSGLTFIDAMSCCTSKGEDMVHEIRTIMSSRFEESKFKILASIDQYCLNEAWVGGRGGSEVSTGFEGSGGSGGNGGSGDSGGSINWLFGIFKNVSKIFIEWFKTSLSEVMTSLYDILIGDGFAMSLAREISNMFANMFKSE